jgi:hypothetical protein
MKKRLLLFAACLSVLTAFAQVEKEDNRWSNLDMKEDSTEIVTIDDIIKEQQDVTSRNTREMHYASVWGRRGFFNIAYNKEATLTPWHPVETGYAPIAKGYFNGGKADWSFALQKGRNYPLHKKPIANTVQICLDYTGLDLSASHYFASAGQYLYDSSQKFDVTTDGKTKSYYYTPWNLEKYEATYGMSLGPSITIAPFNYINYDGIHYLKINVYYHVGYQASVLYMLNNKSKDANQNGGASDYNAMAENLKLLWGHGLYKAYGASMSWKAIGVGFEKRTGDTKYQPLNTADFGKKTAGFKSNFTRFYIQFRM